MSILIAVLVFGLIVFLHELGHFTAAKLSGVTVYRFSIGFGPALIKKEIGGTLYAIRLLPLGGSVVMKGEYDEEGYEVEDKTGSFNAASLPRRFAICVAGPLMNFITGLLLIVVTMWPAVRLPTNLISHVEPEVRQLGIQEGDRITAVNDFHVFVYGDIASALQLGSGRPFDISLLRDGEEFRLKDLPLEMQVYENQDGTKSRRYGLGFATEEATVGAKLRYSLRNSGSFVQSVTQGLKMMIQGQVKKNEVMGTVGIANEISARAKTSALDMWYFVSFLSINLAVMNLLPIPGLDGGKILFLLIEAVRRKPAPVKYEAIIQAVFLGLLFLLFIFVTFNDVMRLMGR